MSPLPPALHEHRNLFWRMAWAILGLAFLAAWPVLKWRGVPGLTGLLIGSGTSLVLSLAGLASLLWAWGRSSHLFLGVSLGGFLGRILIIVLVLAGVYFWQVADFGVTLASLVVTYGVALAIEVMTLASRKGPRHPSI